MLHECIKTGTSKEFQIILHLSKLSDCLYLPFASVICLTVETGAAGAGRLFVDSFFFSFLSFTGGRVGAGRRGCAGGSCAASKGLLFDISS